MPTPTIDASLLNTLRTQAEDARCVVPMCKPFRADVLALLICEIQNWRRFCNGYHYSPDDDKIIRD